jgi:hypothetical protein
MLFSRFDDARLRAVLPSEVSARRCKRSDAVIKACRLGAGPATRPWAQPWLPPRIEWPFGVFQTADAQAARRACLALDGSWWMEDAPGAGARLGTRLRAMAVDAAWWRPLQEADAWDAGIAVDAAQLARFTPRRATLIVVEGDVSEAGRKALASLEQRAYELPRAVRVLLVSSGPVPPFARHIPA